MMGLKEGALICIGNPLLDIVVDGEESLLKKYGLEPNSATLAEEKHKTLFEEIKNYSNVEYIAAGASLNAARVAQSILKKKKVVVAMGCVGQDEYSNILESKSRDDGVDVRFQYTTNQPTGKCAVIITNEGKYRTLCADLAAAQCFTIDHIQTSENANLIKNAECYYITGFFLICSPNSVLHMANESFENQKMFTMNISAPYVCDSQKQHLSTLIPYVDILFGNEREAEAFSKTFELGTSDIKEIALAVSGLPKLNNNKRLVVITQGENPIVIAQNGKVSEIPVEEIPVEKIVNTNGAGDAFVGGFLSQLIQRKPYNVCIKCGNWAAANVIQHSGSVLNSTVDFHY